jgi:hypothetical protein
MQVWAVRSVGKNHRTRLEVKEHQNLVHLFDACVHVPLTHNVLLTSTSNGVRLVDPPVGLCDVAPMLYPLPAPPILWATASPEHADVSSRQHASTHVTVPLHTAMQVAFRHVYL